MVKGAHTVVSVVACCPGSFSFFLSFLLEFSLAPPVGYLIGEGGMGKGKCRTIVCGFTLPSKSSLGHPRLGSERTKRIEECTCLDPGDRLSTLCILRYVYISWRYFACSCSRLVHTCGCIVIYLKKKANLILHEDGYYCTAVCCNLDTMVPGFHLIPVAGIYMYACVSCVKVVLEYSWNWGKGETIH